MTVAIGSVLLLVASMLLGAVLLLAAVGLVLWIAERRRGREGSGSNMWGRDSTEIVGRDTSIAAHGD